MSQVTVSQVTVSQAADDVIAFVEAPLRTVIEEVELQTGYRFLYRDVLVADVSFSLETKVGTLIADFVRVSAGLGIAASVDETRRQILLSPVQKKQPPARAVSGVVVDGETGDPLPYATVAWTVDNRLTGVVADDAGRFVVPGSSPDSVAPVVRFSYVGYIAVEVRGIDLADGFTARLRPDPNLTTEVVVSAVPLETDVDSVWGRVLTSRDMLLLGESNAIRALQALPAVSITGAVSGGAIVRGSRSDGFQVLLDGIPVYSPSHFFGLFDAFNSDALRAVGLYYSVSPAEFAGPPGGTVSFVTRGGSHASPKHRFGLSSTTASSTVEGPLLSGRGTWLISARRSLFDVVNWFGNNDLISLGLDVGRESSAPPIVESLNDRVLRPGESGASFYDVHGKFVIDGLRGGRWILNGYVGGDATSHKAERFVVQRRDTLRRVALRDVETLNDWHNEIVGLRHDGVLVNRGYYSVDLFSSTYGSAYHKDDFSFLRRPVANPLLSETVIDTLANDNSLADRGASTKFHGLISPTVTGTAGFEFHHYDVRYSELAAGYSRTYSAASTATQFDAFVSARRQTGALTASVGLRTHYVLQALRWSPRIRLDATIGKSLSLFGGYARSHQFLHQLYLDTAAEARIWTLSTRDEPPGIADQFSGGFRVAGSTVAFQAELYHKISDGIRQHETVVAKRDVRDEGLVLSPWVHDYHGRSSGIEFMLRATSEKGTLATSYTLAKSELRHDQIQRGAWVAADWDRRHQFVAQLRYALFAKTSILLQWQFGSGSPNLLAVAFPDEPERLDAYHRLDVSLSTTKRVGHVRLVASVSAFNVYDRKNPWYRTTIGVLDGTIGDLRLRNANVDVYDLGFRPSFSLSVSSL
jgi:hypothetical protein